jgi:hypothetical protein
MTGPLSARDRRTLLRGGVAVVLLLFAGRVVPAVRRWSDDRRAIAELRQRENTRASRIAGDAAATRRLLAIARQRLVAYDSALLDAPTYTRASTTLAALVREAAEQTETRVGALELRADTTGTGPLARVSVRATVTGDLMSLALFIESLEAGPRLLAVRDLSIVQPEPSLPPERPETLQAEVLVEGVFRTPAAARGR